MFEGAGTECFKARAHLLSSSYFCILTPAPGFGVSLLAWEDQGSAVPPQTRCGVSRSSTLAPRGRVREHFPPLLWSRGIRVILPQHPRRAEQTRGPAQNCTQPAFACVWLGADLEREGEGRRGVRHLPGLQPAA